MLDADEVKKMSSRDGNISDFGGPQGWYCKPRASAPRHTMRPGRRPLFDN